MKPFEFKGDWEFDYQFEAFKGLQSRRGAYTSMDSTKESDGTVNLVIEDELNEETDPKNEQINAINYIIDHPEKIKTTLYKALELEYPKLKEIYNYDGEDEDMKEWFPDIEHLDDFRKVFGVGNVFIMIAQKEGYSYVGLECGCTWDDEHGLGFLLHKDRLINIGQADSGFSAWEAYEDNGTHEQMKRKWDEIHENRTLLPKPKIYHPHPKYGKLKPSQISANEMYENHLIERGYNQEFIELVEAGKIDINVNNGLSMTFLARAAQFNNLEMVRFLLSKNPKSKNNVLHNAVGHCNKELVEILLERGIDINEPDLWGRTILNLAEQRIALLKGDEHEELNKYEEFAAWLRSKGAK